MYTITLRMDGAFLCVGTYQDGREEWEERGLGAAVRNMKAFAKQMNNDPITRRQIRFYREREVTVVQRVEWDGRL